ncbi:MAG: winged helix-turn-helix domain-containing protein [Dehalococcoidales bacterium]|nr:winged helix-turn-helix domain-containing protein [Dehalococcoidales bacterium]
MIIDTKVRCYSHSGLIFDIFESIKIKHNNYDIFGVAKKTGNTVNPKVVEAYDFLWDKIDITHKGLNLFFKHNKNGAYLYFQLLSLADFWETDSFETFLNNIKGISEERYIMLVLSFWLDYDIKDIAQCKELMNNSQKLFSMIDEASPEDLVKWELYAFLNNSRKILDNFFDFISAYKLKMDTVYDKSRQEIENARDRLISCFDKYGVECIRHRLREVKARLNNFKSISLIPSFMNDLLFLSTYKGSNLYIVTGISQSLLPPEATLNDADIINMLSVLCDPVRAKIFTMLKKDTLYMREIADRLNLSLPTISYHANMLLNVSILTSYSDGRKVYLKVNKDTVNKYIDFLKTD